MYLLWTPKRGDKLIKNSIICRNCGNSSFYFTGYFEEEFDLDGQRIIRQGGCEILEYECSTCKTKHRVIVLPNEK